MSWVYVLLASPRPTVAALSEPALVLLVNPSVALSPSHASLERLWPERFRDLWAKSEQA